MPYNVLKVLDNLVHKNYFFAFFTMLKNRKKLPVGATGKLDFLPRRQIYFITKTITEDKVRKLR